MQKTSKYFVATNIYHVAAVALHKLECNRLGVQPLITGLQTFAKRVRGTMAQKSNLKNTMAIKTIDRKIKCFELKYSSLLESYDYRDSCQNLLVRWSDIFHLRWRGKVPLIGTLR